MIISKPLQAVLAGIVFLIAATCAGQATAQAWTQLAPTGGPPTAREIHSAVFNINSNRMIVFGGLDGGNGCYAGQCLNDVWVLTNADGSAGTPVWTQLSPTGGPPSARGYQAAAYDVANNRLMVFAGDPNIGNCFGAVNDVWVLSNADGTGGTPVWTQLSPTGGPPQLRQGPTAVYDAATNRMVVFGGDTNACGAISNAVWVLTNANGLGGAPVWTQLAPSGAPPTARFLHSSVYNVATNRMIVFGGCCGLMNDTWVLSNANGMGSPVWIPLSPTGGPPPARYLHSAVYDPATNRMVVFGGSSTVGVVNDVWVLSHADGTGGTPAWTQLSPTGTPPVARYGHSAVYNAANNRMIVFAGYGGGFLNDTWVLTGASGIIDIPVAIDIRPFSTVNTISLTYGTEFPVAILSSAYFDAPSMVDRASLTFGRTGNEASLISCDIRAQDVNGDQRRDLLCHFSVKQSAFQLGDTVGLLKGRTLVGNTIHGSDSVNIIH